VSKDSVSVSISASNSSLLESLFKILTVTNQSISSQYNCFYTSKWPHFLSQSPPSAADCYVLSHSPPVTGTYANKMVRHPEIVRPQAASLLHWLSTKFGQTKLALVNVKWSVQWNSAICWQDMMRRWHSPEWTVATNGRAALKMFVAHDHKNQSDQNNKGTRRSTIHDGSLPIAAAVHAASTFAHAVYEQTNLWTWEHLVYSAAVPIIYKLPPRCVVPTPNVQHESTTQSIRRTWRLRW
jgi:hypothetical protein